VVEIPLIFFTLKTNNTMKVLFFILLIALTSCKAQQPKEEITLITKTCLAELCSSNDEVECFAFYFDIKPDSIKTNLNAYRVQYSLELRNKGWNPTSPFDLINFKVPFDQNGYIIDWETFKKFHSIDNNNEEKTLFHYEIED
jgi:hypothetical protein